MESTINRREFVVEITSDIGGVKTYTYSRRTVKVTVKVINYANNK